jgi:hypothetical protein
VRYFVLALIVIAACGGSQQPFDWDKKLAKENEITALWTQIRDWRREAHMDLDPAPGIELQMKNRSVPEAKRVCPEVHEVPPKCNDKCDLSVAICDNAESICRIADELGKGDEYAQEKCASAKASCREAKQRCCNCSAPMPQSTMPAVIP